MWSKGDCVRMAVPSPSVADLPVEERDLPGADLSAWFNPFLSFFAGEARRCGGEARIFREGGRVVGLLVTDPIERVASILSRIPSVAEPWVHGRGSMGIYCDFPIEPGSEAFDIFSVTLTAGLPTHRFRHALRPFSGKDLPAVLDLMREVYGVVNERWFDDVPNPSEAGLLAEVDGRLAGVGWASRVGRHARLHSLTVRAPFRRLGIGTDLVFGRLLWARRNGVEEALSEISVRNVGSQAAAVRAGMRRVGRMYYYPPM